MSQFFRGICTLQSIGYSEMDRPVSLGLIFECVPWTGEARDRVHRASLPGSATFPDSATLGMLQGDGVRAWEPGHDEDRGVRRSGAGGLGAGVGLRASLGAGTVARTALSGGAKAQRTEADQVGTHQESGAIAGPASQPTLDGRATGPRVRPDLLLSAAGEEKVSADHQQQSDKGTRSIMLVV
jgi:hypothetical protein